ncbi:hypothetical protein CFP56_015216 [Quercus suber]|uniref:Uncharacterized protein n=1 Tax=Quercus suber TaxID=58331 RepID=A0AAW0M1R5_QUESU
MALEGAEWQKAIEDHSQIFRTEGKARGGALAVIAVGRAGSNNRNRKRTYSLKVESSSLLVDKDKSRPRLTTGISTNGTSKSPPSLSLRIYFSGSSSPLRTSSWTLFCTIGVLKAGADSAMLRV